MLLISAPPAIGDLALGLPEIVAGNTGFSALHPSGQPWTQLNGQFVQEVRESDVARYPYFELYPGLRAPSEGPVRWTTTVTSTHDTVTFNIRLTNTGDREIKKAAASIDFLFRSQAELDKPLDHPAAKDWWADENVYVVSGGKITTLAELGRDAGLRPNMFQAYLLREETFDNIFYREAWGFNRHRLDKPIMISEHREAGLCVGITADHAYFLLSNASNPCTDIMLAFGNLAPGATAEATGRVWIKPGRAGDFLSEAYAIEAIQ